MAKKQNVCLAPPPQRVELSDNPVKLCNEISRIFRDCLRRENDAEGVMTQPGAHLVLSFLATGDGTTQLELVRSTHLKAPSVSLILKKMEEEGIVQRRCDEHDARAVRVYLTEYGKKIDREHIKKIKAMDTAALEGISEAEQKSMMELLAKIRNNLINKKDGEGRDNDGENI